MITQMISAFMETPLTEDRLMDSSFADMFTCIGDRYYTSHIDDPLVPDKFNIGMLKIVDDYLSEQKRPLASAMVHIILTDGSRVFAEELKAIYNLERFLAAGRDTYGFRVGPYMAELRKIFNQWWFYYRCVCFDQLKCIDSNTDYADNALVFVTNNSNGHRIDFGGLCTIKDTPEDKTLHKLYLPECAGFFKLNQFGLYGQLKYHEPPLRVFRIDQLNNNCCYVLTRGDDFILTSPKAILDMFDRFKN